MSDSTSKDAKLRGVMNINTPRPTPSEEWLKELQDSAELVSELRQRTESGIPFRAPSVTRP